jgi:hypothetical protein
MANAAPPRRLPANDEARPLSGAAEGTLRRNAEARPGEPPFALLDGQGRVACYVQPQADLDLTDHLGRRVKLSGTRTLPPGQRTAIFTATGIQSAAKVRAALAKAIGSVVDPEAAAAAHQEEIPPPIELTAPGETYYEGPIEGALEGEVIHEGPSCGTEVFQNQCNACNNWGCDRCGRGCCLSGLYVRGEYLYWWTDGLYAPALVTTSSAGTPRVNAGVLGPATTSILFGQESLNNEGSNGGRLTAGWWWDPNHCHAFEGDVWGLDVNDDDFRASSPGSPILARPYFDLLGGTEGAELVAFPGIVRGSVAVDTDTTVWGAGLRKRWNICGMPDCDPCWSCGWRYDVTAGYRFMRLEDSIAIREDLVSLDTANAGSFVVSDAFDTENTFNGGEIGAVYEGRRGRWAFDFLGRIALGSTHSRVAINGFTDITAPGAETVRSRGGLLAQRTNIGVYERDSFAVIPELGATVGLQVTSVWRITFGYSFIYWSNVVRAGQQIDRDINENLLPPEADPFTGAERPRFVFNDTDFWAQGVNVGLDARW